MDIHNYRGQLECTLTRLRQANDISDANKKAIVRFRDYLFSEGIGLAKINRYLIDACKYTRLVGKPVEEANKDDVRKAVAEIEQSELSPETKKGFKIMLRKLYRFLRGIEAKGQYPEEVKWISIHIAEKHRKLPEELLTHEEIWRIVQKCDTARDKAFFAALAESGCRVSEIGTMQIKHVAFEEYGARLTVNGKTGMRKILVINAAPYLQEWINLHPYNSSPESYLWIKNDGGVLSYARVAAILKGAAKLAGIQKRIYPHLLRHSRATALAPIMSDASMKHYFGWTQGSAMASIYIHMSGKDTDDAILRANGITVSKNNEQAILKPKNCIRCRTVNEATNVCCRMCGMVLDQGKQNEILQQDMKRKEADRVMNDLMEDKEFLALMLRKLQEKIVQTPAVGS